MGIEREGLTSLFYFTLLPPPTLDLAAWDRQWSPYKLKMSEHLVTAACRGKSEEERPNIQYLKLKIEN